MAGELAADLAAFPFDASDAHVVVGGGLVSHPGNCGGLDALLDRDALGAGYGAAADGRGVGGDAGGELVGKQAVAGVEREELVDGAFEVFDIFVLFDVPAPSPGFELALVGRAVSVGGELIAKARNAVGRGVDATGEALAPIDLDDFPMWAVCLDTASEGGVAGRQKSPAGRNAEYLAGGGEDVALLGEGADFEGLFNHAGKPIEGWGGRASRYWLEAGFAEVGPC